MRIEEETDSIHLKMDEDSVLHEHTPGPSIQLEFETEDQLKNFMHKLTDAGLLAEGTLAFVQNISEDFLKEFENISSVTDSEYDNDDLSD